MDMDIISQRCGEEWMRWEHRIQKVFLQYCSVKLRMNKWERYVQLVYPNKGQWAAMFCTDAMRIIVIFISNKEESGAERGPVIKQELWEVQRSRASISSFLASCPVLCIGSALLQSFLNLDQWGHFTFRSGENPSLLMFSCFTAGQRAESYTVQKPHICLEVNDIDIFFLIWRCFIHNLQ